MNGYTQTFANGGSGHRPPNQRRATDLAQPRPSSERMASDRSGAVPMQMGSAQRMLGSASSEQVAGPAQIGGPRSPPKNKNTQHVPCKFFVHGQCQAGQTCPFSHDLESTTRPAPCKYFAKGSCKFGRKCALLHITPEGTVVNRPPAAAFPPAPPLSGTQSQMGQFPTQPPAPGLLTQGLEQRPGTDGQMDYENYPYPPRNGPNMQHIDMTFTTTSSQYGSSPQDGRFAGSPPSRSQGLSVLDAPLPNSFDSNGVSMAARNGPFAASVPSRFGVESPPSSLPRKYQPGNSALRDLHNSAFGDRGMDRVLASCSPPSGSDEPLTFPKRSLHSERFAPKQIISTSLGNKLPTQSFEYSDDEEDAGNADREEDLLPAALHDLIPEASRARRESRPRTKDDNSPASFLAAQRRNISGHGTPQDSKVGSPHASSSPSRFTGVFIRRSTDNSDNNSGATGHFGSPLRNTNFAFNSTPSSVPRSSTSSARGDLSPTISSPPRQASMSMLTQELQRTKFEAAVASSSATSVQRSISNGSNGGGRASLDRAVNNQNVGRGRIDEEQELFDMDEVGAFSGDASRTGIPRNNDLLSSSAAAANNAWGNEGGNYRPLGSSPPSEPTFGAIGAHRTEK